jgi:type IV pilus assembly protein PilY1
MKRLILWLLVLLCVPFLGGSLAQSTSNRTTLDLRTGPIINSGDVANLALVLSVEYPTVRTAYQGGSYTATKKYIGYFSATTCYGYNGTSADGYFQPTGATTAQYYCNTGGAASGFSGNFLNFAATSSMDILRLALTGGDRLVDVAAGNTVLQRALLPGDPESGNSIPSFYGNTNFPLRTLTAGTPTSYLTPFGSSTAVYVKSCEDKIFFGSANSGSCTTPGSGGNKALTNTAGATVTGTFKARVMVCSDTEGPVRTDLCRQYPDGHYKPVGEIQKNADKVRVAAFGYLLDQTREPVRYGGVLRAPMRFVGPNQKDAYGIVSSNPAPEWNDNTGVFYAKPLDTATEAAFTTSGVINYLNRFGRTGSPPGIYKIYDPVGELYYEAIRYFQNLGPTSSTNGGCATAANCTPVPSPVPAAYLDGYPIYTTWSDPMQNACQRNYAMVIGDNNTWWDASLPGSTISGHVRSAVSANAGAGVVAFDADYWTRRVESFETNGSLTYTDAQGVSRTANGNSTAASSGTNTGVVSGNTTLATRATGALGASFLWAGAAYFANTQSIRSDKPLARVRTFSIDVDEYGNGDINNTRGRAFYLAGKYGGFADVGPDGSASTGDGNPFKTYVGGVLSSSSQEWLATDGSASPSGYFLSSQPERMLLAIKQIFAQAAKPSGNLAGGSLSVNRLSAAQQAGAYYSAQLNASDWSGTVVRTGLTFNTSTLALEASATPVWDAANILTGIQANTTTLAPFPLPANRNIISYSNTTQAGITMTWANLDAAVKTSLKTEPSTNVLETDTDGEARLDYLRGSRAAETDPTYSYRGRSRIMGDSINSAPVLKGAPSSDIVDTSYQTFYTTNLGRTPTVYIGSNDGMLHAFRAADAAANTTNGQELFAYVPRAVSLKLNKLADPAYVKEAYVDGSIAVNEARIYKPSGVGWGTVLLSGMGGGAKGLFALDVTSPHTFTKDNVLWEFTNADDADMGNLVAEPRVVKLAMNGISNATPNYKWFAMVTSGYNNYTTGGSNDKQALFLLSLEKAPGVAWSIGVNYFKITADNSSFASTSTAATGLGMPGVATGVSGNTKLAYAGDLQGNLWRFDLRGASSTWTGSTQAKVLFIAKSSAGVVQPITVVPAVSLNVAMGYQIGFGTGKFIEPLDGLAASAAQQTLYGVWDADDGVTFQRVATGAGSPPVVNGLASRTLTASSGTTTVSITGSAFSYGTSSVTGSNQYRGWYADLSTTMERIAVDPTVEGGLMAVNSTIPGGDPCVPTGASRQYRYNPTTGITFATTGNSNAIGYLGSASLLQVGDSIWTARSSAGRYLVTRKINSISAGVAGGLSTQESLVTSVAGRISWREITNFQ